MKKQVTKTKQHTFKYFIFKYLLKVRQDVSAIYTFAASLVYKIKPDITILVSNFIIYLAVGLFTVITAPLSAQKFKYLVNPGLSNIDDFVYDSVVQGTTLFPVRSKGKWGVIKSNDEALVPMMYDSVKIDAKAKMILAFNQNSVSNFGINGRQLSYLQTDSLFRVRDHKKWVNLAGEINAALKQQLPGLTLHYLENTLPEVTLKNKNNQVVDSLRLQENTKVYTSKEGYVFINGSMYSKSGEKIKPSNKYTKLIPCSTGFILAKQMGFWGLLNAHGKPLLPCIYTSIDTLDGIPLFLYGRNNQYYLADSLNKRVVSQPVIKIVQPGAKGHIVFYFPNKTLSYNALTNTIVQWDFVIEKPFGKTGYWLIKKFGSFGCADLNTGEELIPAKYVDIWEAGDGYVVAADGKKNDGQMKAMDVYYNYKLVHQNRLIQFLPFADGILTEAEAERCVLGAQYLENYCLPKGTFYPSSRGHLISAYSDETGPGVFLSKQFADRNFKNPYETAIDLKQPLTVNGKPGLWVRYSKSWGVVDYEGNVLIDFQWEEMKEIMGMPQVFKVKKDGRWGVIRVE